MYSWTPHEYIWIWVNTWVYEESTNVCLCVCGRACMYCHMYVLEGEPTLLPFTSTAIEHLCLALLLVATVTKAQSGVAAAAKQRARDGGKTERERERLCLWSYKRRFEWNVNTTERKIVILYILFLSPTCIYISMNACAVVRCGTDHGLSISVLSVSVLLGRLTVRLCLQTDCWGFLFMSVCFLMASKCSSVTTGIGLFSLSQFSMLKMHWSCTTTWIVEMSWANMNMSTMKLKATEAF